MQKELTERFAMQKSNKISITIPVIGQLKYTKICMESLLKNSSLVDEVILLENSPEGETAKWIIENYGKKISLTVIYTGEKLGVAISWDYGIKAARNNIVIVSNNDINFCEPGWDVKLIEQWKKYPNVACFSPWPVSGPEEPLSTNNKPMSGLAGCCYAIKKDMLEKIENFKEKGMYIDHGFKRAYWEDADLLTQIRRAKMESLVTPYTKVIHYGNKTAGPMLPSDKSMTNPYWINLDYFNKKYDVQIWDYFKVHMSNILHETSNKRLI